MPDARTVPWADVTRLCLEGGAFPPATRPVTWAELQQRLDVVHGEALSGEAAALADDAEFARLQWLRGLAARGGTGLRWDGCDCKTHPPRLRLGGRLVGGYSGLGEPVPEEGGLAFTPGTSLFIEPMAEWSAGRFRAAFAWRMGGVVTDGGRTPDPDSPLAWPDWNRATGRADVRDVRLSEGTWQGRVTRAVVGASLGRWAVDLGWDHRRTGPGLTGDLNQDYGGRPFPAMTIRRTAPFRWRGIMGPVAPAEFLGRLGRLSARRVRYEDEAGEVLENRHPWFMQWLVGLQPTSWFRVQGTHSVMVVARDGNPLPDLLQINFPLIGTTWREQESGPVTDRIFAVQFEFRWRDAPWPVLPAAAGRAWWNYGGTDFLPSGPGGVVPEISIPASVVGCELVSPSWDVAAEYAELWHDKVLWYANGGFAEGYGHRQTLLAHPLGGSAEAWTGWVRWRPRTGGAALTLRGQDTTWGARGLTPGTGQRRSLALSVRRSPVSGDWTGPVWEATLEWVREEADPGAFGAAGPSVTHEREDWWRLVWKVEI